MSGPSRAHTVLVPLLHAASDGHALTISWSLGAPATAVWEGLTNPLLLGQWLGRAEECTIEPGGGLVVDHGEGFRSRSAVCEVSAPVMLRVTWEFPDEPVSDLTFQLSGEEQTTLTLSHRGLGPLTTSYRIGWIVHLTFLEAAVGGNPIPRSEFWRIHDTLQTLDASSS